MPTDHRRTAVPPAAARPGTGSLAGVPAPDEDRLLAQVDQPDGTGAGPPVVISAVSGTAGVGKTALAVRWARLVRRRFPDGQLYVNLRGYDADRPVSAADALAGFLRALGVAGPDIPIDMDERAAAYRTLLDGRRMLVVLDNAATVEQVRPLLPGSPSCLVVVTSRDSLAGLVAGHGARRLDLDLLAPDDAVALLRRLIGGRVEAEPEAAATLAGQCARLPLALRVAAELAAARPAATLAQLVDELADQKRRLDLLDAGGDARTAVRSVFSWSYQHLPAAAARTFRLLGLFPGLAVDLDTYAAAALTDSGLSEAQQLLNMLARAHLIHATDSARYGMHDLLHAYATQLATAEDGRQERRAALTRLFDYYLATAAAAMDTLLPVAVSRRSRMPAPAMPIPPVEEPSAAPEVVTGNRSRHRKLAAAPRTRLRQVTSFSLPVATSKTNPRMESLTGMNGLLVIRATDCLTSAAGSSNASAAQGGLIPVSSWIERRKASSEKVSMPQSVWWMRMISRVPSSRWLIASERISSSVTTPPALRITCASPSARPRIAYTFSRASMHATTATWRDGGSGSGPAKVSA